MGVVQRTAGTSRDWGDAGAGASLVQLPTQAAGEQPGEGGGWGWKLLNSKVQ